MGRHALLLGTATCLADRDLQPLPGVRQDVAQLKAVLGTDGDFDSIDAFIDLPATQLRQVVEGFYRTRRTDDLALFYYSGHGTLHNDRQSLFLAATGNPHATAFDVDGMLRHLLNHTNLTRRNSIIGPGPRGAGEPSGPGSDNASCSERREIMPRYVSIVADDDQTGVPILIEVDSGAGPSGVTEESEGLVDVGRRSDHVIKRATESIGQMTQRVRPVAEGIARMFRDAADPPDEVQVKFGIKLNSEADVVVSRASVGANFEVTVTWRGQANPADDEAAAENAR